MIPLIESNAFKFKVYIYIIYIHIDNTLNLNNGFFSIVNKNVYFNRVFTKNNILYVLFDLKDTEVTEDKLWIYESEFADNTFSLSLLDIDKGNVEIRKSKFTNNEGHLTGSIIQAFYSNLFIFESVFNNSNLRSENLEIRNTAGYFYIMESNLTLNNSVMIGGRGLIAGVLYSVGANILIANSIINGSYSKTAVLFSSSDKYIYIYD